MNGKILFPADRAVLSFLPPTVDETFDLCEVWEGIPPFPFSEEAARNGQKALVARTPEVYVWISPSTRKAVQINPVQILIALGARRGEKVKIHYTETCRSKPEAIARATKFNDDEVAKFLQRRRPPPPTS